MRHHSMAKRKQTMASAEKTPMKTDRIRKKCSSRISDRRGVPEARPESGASIVRVGRDVHASSLHAILKSAVVPCPSLLELRNRHWLGARS